jgi:hypothetical protein
MDEIKISDFQKKIKNQDFSQRVNVFISIILELYRVITCSLLIIFVPQKCDDHICSVNENLEWDPQTFYNATIVFNFITLFTFCPLYYLELMRENRLIKYLDINPAMPCDNKEVEIKMEKLPLDKKNKIKQIDKYYQKYAYIVIGVYTINVIFSGIIISEYYIGNQTASTFITYILLILTKLENVYMVANTEENIFYSAYMKKNIQYNDLDESYKLITNDQCVTTNNENELEMNEMNEINDQI